MKLSTLSIFVQLPPKKLRSLVNEMKYTKSTRNANNLIIIGFYFLLILILLFSVFLLILAA